MNSLEDELSMPVTNIICAPPAPMPMSVDLGMLGTQPVSSNPYPPTPRPLDLNPDFELHDHHHHNHHQPSAPAHRPHSSSCSSSSSSSAKPYQPIPPRDMYTEGDVLCKFVVAALNQLPGFKQTLEPIDPSRGTPFTIGFYHNSNTDCLIESLATKAIENMRKTETAVKERRWKHVLFYVETENFEDGILVQCRWTICDRALFAYNSRPSYSSVAIDKFISNGLESCGLINVQAYHDQVLTVAGNNIYSTRLIYLDGMDLIRFLASDGIHAISDALLEVVNRDWDRSKTVYKTTTIIEPKGATVDGVVYTGRVVVLNIDIFVNEQ